MTVLIPSTLDDALDALANHPEALVLSGGTDAMVEINYDHRRADDVVSLRRVDALRDWQIDSGLVTLGAAVTYRTIQESALADASPGLAMASRTVGSPQIRNTGTVGGNVATASPAGDTIPVLVALDAEVEVASVRGRRRVALTDLIVGVKRTTLEPDELIVAFRFPVAAGPQEFLKIGTRNAMVISVASCALAVDTSSRTIACVPGSVSARPARAIDAEDFAVANVDWDTMTVDDPRTFETFGAMVAASTSPIDDHRSSAAYRRHGVGVMARRALHRAFGDPS